MVRWTIRILAGLCGLIVVTALTGAAYQWLATRKDLAATPPPGHLVGGYRLHLWCTGNVAPAVILDNGLGGSQRSRAIATDSTPHRYRAGRTPLPQRDNRTGGARRGPHRRFQRSCVRFHRCANLRGRRVSAQPDTRRRRTRLFMFERARRKSGARAASSRSLSSWSPVDEEPGHVVSVDPPDVVVNAIRTVVETARGHTVPHCATAANVERDPS
jgi:hypothetical protein